MASCERPLVLHVITGLGIGGAERVLVRSISLSKSFDHEVIVLARAGPIAADIERLGVQVVSLNSTPSVRGALRLLSLRKRIRDRQPAIVQSWLVHANIAATLATPPGVPLIWNVRHTLDGFERERRMTRLAVRASTLASHRPKAIIYNSHRAAEQHEALGYPRSARALIFNGFTSEDDRKAGRAETRAALGLETEDVAIGLVARVHAIKNHDGFLIAARQLTADFPRARFVLVGTGTGLKDDLALRYGPHFGSRALWLGERSDIPAVTSALDIACNVSHGEAFSNTLGEAMAVGVPCVATDVGESANILGETGWLARGTSPEAIENALRAALSADAGERRRRGEAARERIRTKFSMVAAADRYEQVYDRVLRHHKPRASDGNGLTECAE